MKVRLHTSDDFPGIKGNPDELTAKGWRYYDLPWLTPDAWKQFFGVVGDENYMILVMSERPSGNKHAQVLISPAGIEAMGNYAAARRA